MEEITLYGGPADGRRFTWNGGDQLEYIAPTGDLSVRAKSEGFRDVAREIRTVYFRSKVTRTIFVYQP